MARSAPPPLWPGEGGMVELRYIGQAPNRRFWTGPVTEIRYPFGPSEVRYVDKRDAAIWLHPKRGNGKAFEVADD